MKMCTTAKKRLCSSHNLSILPEYEWLLSLGTNSRREISTRQLRRDRHTKSPSLKVEPGLFTLNFIHRLFTMWGCNRLKVIPGSSKLNKPRTEYRLTANLWGFYMRECSKERWGPTHSLPNRCDWGQWDDWRRNEGCEAELRGNLR